ncbi:hypothetical protein Ciccas_010903 [Cichlidogyrus casuarinus]|uniref:BZIP domain-containing protein n=1 Tax=Cichlidogyrus casuarinus TaxID=1844966 RepID=A0ABD2PST1_9PLAT
MNKRAHDQAFMSPNSQGSSGGYNSCSQLIQSRSSESARDCRKRKALRIQYLNESVKQREVAVTKMTSDINKLIQVCKHLDNEEIPRNLLSDLSLVLFS